MSKIVIANWKMNVRHAKAVTYAAALRKQAVRGVDLVVAPSLTVLPSVAEKLRGSRVKVAAQDVAAWSEGAYTGEVSARMLKDAGATYTIIGHSERRQLLGETDAMVHDKVAQALKAKLRPILCVGETDEERKAGKRDTVLVQQLRNALSKVPDLHDSRLVVAYEPVWAIGSGQAVQPDDLAQAYKVIKRAVTSLTTSAYWAAKVRFVYGGSVDAENAALFAAQEYVDGFLVGGASLQVKKFLAIAKQCV